MKLIFTRCEVAAVLAGLALAAASLAYAKEPIELYFSNQPWHLLLSAGDLKPVKGAPSSPDRQIFTYSNDRKMLLSVMVENAHEPAVMESCRAVFEQRTTSDPGHAAPRNEWHGQRGEAAIQEYDVNLGDVVMRNILTCRVRGTYYIDVYASMMDDQPSDHDALLALVDGVRIVE